MPRLSPFKKAFSLIELAIVILIIGIVISIIIGNDSLISMAKLKKAQQLTQNSPVKEIGGSDGSLVAWFEASLEDAMVKNISDNKVSKWFNRGVNSKNYGLQEILENQPIFTEKAINELPALKFDGINDILDMDSVLDSGDNTYTYISVFQANVATDQYVFAQAKNPPTAGEQASLFLGVGQAIGFNSHTNNFNSTHNYSIGEPIIFIAVMNGVNVTVYHNGRADSTSSLNASFINNLGTDNAHIGGNINIGSFNGYISELIIYNKSLTTDEVEEINLYLSTKYNIKLNE